MLTPEASICIVIPIYCTDCQYLCIFGEFYAFNNTERHVTSVLVYDMLHTTVNTELWPGRSSDLSTSNVYL